MDAKKLGAFLFELRKKSTYKQQDVAQNIHVTPQAISKWERGEGLPDFPLLLSLCNFYHITIDAMLEQREEENNTPYLFDAKKVGKTIRALRKKKHQTQKEMANDLQVTFQSVSKWEKGNALPNYAMLEKIIAYFHISYHSLFQYQAFLEEKKRRWGIASFACFFCTLALISTLLHFALHADHTEDSSLQGPNDQTTSEVQDQVLVVLYDGETEFAHVYVKLGQYLTYIPKKSGFVFSYYAYDLALTKPFDMEHTPIQEELSLYIAWKNA